MKQTEIKQTKELSNNNTPFDPQSKLTIVKRDGSLVTFKPNRIKKAIEAAFRDTKKLEGSLGSAMNNEIHRLTDLVVDQAAHLGNKGVCLNVEGIQDLVEVTLMKSGLHDIAKDYILYRDEHKKLRQDPLKEFMIFRHEHGTKTPFKPMKIAATLEKIFRKSSAVEPKDDQELILCVNALTQIIVENLLSKHNKGLDIYLTHIQEAIEEALMKEGYFKEAKNYILKDDEPAKNSQSVIKGKTFLIKGRDGKEFRLSTKEIEKKLTFASREFKEKINVKDLIAATLSNFFEGMTEDDVEKALVMGSRAKVESDPCYAFVTARLLLDKIYIETMGVAANDSKLKAKHKQAFKNYIKFGISVDRINPELLNYDLDKLANAIDLSRDLLFEYLGLQTIYDRYLIHEKERRLETPQIFWMRVAMGLALNEENREEKAIEFYNIMSTFHYLPGTPTLFNSGTTHSQLSSCYLSTIEDDLAHIYKTISDDAQLSKWAGGLGNDWTNVRATGSVIKGTNGKSQGIIPFLKVANDTAVAVNQGGKRKGAMCAYLETWHLDIQDFLELRKNTGDERRRTHDMNTANWIPDLFMMRVQKKEQWTLFSPSDCPDLHDLYGKKFNDAYIEYEKMADEGKIKLFKRVNAVDLFRKMLSMIFETGHPWITFKDPSNIRSPQDHMGVVHSSNLCTEILLNTSREETAVCNLGSINLVKHISVNGLDEDKLEKTVNTAIRMLDNVIDINFYPIDEAKNANAKHRPVGLGMMGFQDALHILKFNYASHEAIEFADTSMEAISYYAICASARLADERGTYSSYKGSKWDRGLLPIDTIGHVALERGQDVTMNTDTKKDWQVARDLVAKHGMRNSNTMAIAPTATIANISGVSQSVEPAYKHLYVKSNLSGEFTQINRYLAQELQDRGLFNDDLVDDLKYYDGSLKEIESIPQDLKALFPTAFEIAPEWIIEAASRRQKWIDMGQSLNLYLSEPSGKKLYDMYMLAFNSGLKTTYYLRSLAATQVEKSTTDINKRGLQPRWMKNKSASDSIQIKRSQPQSCSMQEGCESCQ
jgi:ribonucleoside-diphosphate reductase alpha chain